MKGLILSTIIFSLCFLSACCSPEDYSEGIDDGSAAYDQAKRDLSRENQQAMDQFMVKMQVAMRAYMDQGKDASKQQMGEMITALMVVSSSQQGNVETMVKNTMAKAISSDPTLRARMMGMATMDPQGLASAAEGFIETIRQRAGGGNQITQGEALMRSDAAASAVSSGTGSAATGYAMKRATRAETSASVATKRQPRADAAAVGRGYGVTSTQPDILMPMAKLAR